MKDSMNVKKKVSVIACVATLLVIFSMLLVQAIPSKPRYGPYIDTMWMSVIIGPDSQLNAMLEHQVDAGGVPRPADLPTLDAAGFTTASVIRLGMNFLFENNWIYPCNDEGFRKGINRLVDKDALTELLYPLQSPMEYWLPPSMGEWVADGGVDPGYPGGYRPDYPLPWFDPGMPDDTGTDSAYSHLNDGGWIMTDVENPWYDSEVEWSSEYLRTAPNPADRDPDGTMGWIEYVARPYAESPLYYEHASIINHCMHLAGIKTLFVTKAWTEFVAILINTDYEDYQMMTGVGLVWSPGYPDIQYAIYKSDQKPLWNVWNFEDEDMDNYCIQMKATLDYQQLKIATMETQRIAARDEPMLPVMMYNTWTTFSGPYGDNPGHIGIVNDVGAGGVASYNEWGKLIGRSGRTASPDDINVWWVGAYLDTINPLTADTTPDWGLLELVAGEGGQLNPYTAAYMPWTLARDPGQDQVEWDGIPGHEVIGSHFYYEIREGLKWHDGTPITAEDAVFGLDLLRFQDNERYRANWEPIYDVIQTGTYTFEVYYDMRYFFAPRDVGNNAFYTPKHIWEPYIQPEIDEGAGPMGGDVWTGWAEHHAEWEGWTESLGPDEYNGYPELELTKLIGNGPFIYHLGGWEPGNLWHLEANPYYMGTNPADPVTWCPGDVNKDHYTDGRDVWHVLRRQGHEEYMPVWYQYVGTGPALQGMSVDCFWPAQIIDGAENSLMKVPHTGHWSGIGEAPDGWLKEPPGPPTQG